MNLTAVDTGHTQKDVRVDTTTRAPYHGRVAATAARLPPVNVGGQARPRESMMPRLAVPSLAALPTDVLEQVMASVEGPVALRALSQTCRALHATARRPEVAQRVARAMAARCPFAIDSEAVATSVGWQRAVRSLGLAEGLEPPQRWRRPTLVNGFRDDPALQDDGAGWSFTTYSVATFSTTARGAGEPVEYHKTSLGVGREGGRTYGVSARECAAWGSRVCYQHYTESLAQLPAGWRGVVYGLGAQALLLVAWPQGRAVVWHVDDRAAQPGPVTMVFDGDVAPGTAHALAVGRACLAALERDVDGELGVAVVAPRRGAARRERAAGWAAACAGRARRAAGQLCRWLARCARGLWQWARHACSALGGWVSRPHA